MTPMAYRSHNRRSSRSQRLYSSLSTRAPRYSRLAVGTGHLMSTPRHWRRYHRLRHSHHHRIVYQYIRVHSRMWRSQNCTPCLEDSHHRSNSPMLRRAHLHCTRSPQHKYHMSLRSYHHHTLCYCRWAHIVRRCRGSPRPRRL